MGPAWRVATTAAQVKAWSHAKHTAEEEKPCMRTPLMENAEGTGHSVRRLLTLNSQEGSSIGGTQRRVLLRTKGFILSIETWS